MIQAKEIASARPIPSSPSRLSIITYKHTGNQKPIPIISISLNNKKTALKRFWVK